MPVAEPASPDSGRRELNVSLSLRTILLVAGLAAVAWALASIANVLLVIFVSLFGVAVLSPVVTAMERRLGWSRGWCATVLVLAIVPVSGQAEAVPASHGSDHRHDLALHARQLGDLCDLRDGLWRHCVGARPPVPARRGGHRGDPRPNPQRRRDDRRHHHRT